MPDKAQLIGRLETLCSEYQDAPDRELIAAVGVMALLVHSLQSGEAELMFNHCSALGMNQLTRLKAAHDRRQAGEN